MEAEELFYLAIEICWWTCDQGRDDENLELINGKDPYETPRKAWKDDMDIWPGMTYVRPRGYVLGVPAKPLQWGGSNELQESRMLSTFYGWVGEGNISDAGG